MPDHQSDNDPQHYVTRGVLDPPEIPVHPMLTIDRGQWIAVCDCCGDRSLAMRVPGPPRDTWPEITVLPGQCFYALDCRAIELPLYWRRVSDDATLVDVLLCPFCSQFAPVGERA